MYKFRADVYIEDNKAETIIYGNTQEEVENDITEWVEEQYSEVYGGDPFTVTVNVSVEENHGATWEPVWEGDMEVEVEPQEV